MTLIPENKSKEQSNQPNKGKIFGMTVRLLLPLRLTYTHTHELMCEYIEV